MIRTLQCKILLLGILIMATLQMTAQGWEKKYSPDAQMHISTIYPTSGSGYLVTGWGQNNNFQRIMKIDDNGGVLWKVDADSIESVTFDNITQDRGLVMICNGNLVFERNILRVDSNGNKVWLRPLHHELQPGYTGNADIDTTNDGGFICTYNLLDSTGGNTRVHIYVSRLDALGNILWDSTYYTSDTLAYSYSIRNAGDGGFIVGIYVNRSQSITFKIDANGHRLWENRSVIQSASNPALITRDGNIVLTAFSNGRNSITKLDQNGNQLWSHTYVTPDTVDWGRPIERADHSYALIGVIRVNNNDYFSLSLADSLGNVLLYKKLPTTNLGFNSPLLPTGYRSFASSHEGGYLTGGLLNQNLGDYSGFIIKMDSTGQVYPSSLSGNVFFDANNNCTKDAGEIYMSPVYVTLTNGTDTSTTVTADSGYFSLGLYSGSFGIQVQPPSPYWQASSCDLTSGSLATGADTSILLGLTPILSSPYITISGHMSRQVVCRPVVYTVEYCNTGTAPFTGSVQVNIDTILQVDSSSIVSASHIGNQYTFNVDTLGVMQCASINVYCTVPCDQSYFNRTTCSEALAYQDTIVNPSPLWDRSNLDMAVHYDPVSDTITFTLKNKGTGGMSGPEGLIVIEDNVILMTLPTQLPSGAQRLQQIKANGATWRATIDQTPYNPYSKYTTAAIEAAGTNTQGGVSLGYITQYPYNGFTSYQDNTCATVYASYDPNEKSVAPIGAGPNHLIDTNVSLEYSIDFQNTGTASAYTVVVTDTLAPYLDISTVRMEASSKPCQLQISGANLLTFTFNNINLPDTSAGQLLSTGFVKFRVNQNPGNPDGTVINNKAGIYFDYNAPVVTNTATVRIGQVYVTGITSVYGDKLVQISAYPNPFLTSTLIKVDGEKFTDLALDIYDISGQLVKHLDVKNANSFTIDRSGLNKGEYVFRITGNGKPVGNGKIIAE